MIDKLMQAQVSQAVSILTKVPEDQKEKMTAAEFISTFKPKKHNACMDRGVHIRVEKDKKYQHLCQCVIKSYLKSGRDVEIIPNKEKEPMQ
jgi:hypothetical protein